MQTALPRHAAACAMPARARCSIAATAAARRSASWRWHRAAASGVQMISTVGAAASNGNSDAAGISPGCPSAAEVARTVADLCREGSLAALGPDGAPAVAPVGYSLDASGDPMLSLPGGWPVPAPGTSLSLLVQPPSHPARGLAAVALQGAATEGAEPGTLRLAVQSCVCYGGFGSSSPSQAVSGDEYRVAEPDLLRHAAAELIDTWNGDRAEDIYRIVAHHLGVQLSEMAYAELLWVDRLGLYVRAETAGSSGPGTVRVAFPRPVLDERDARSVVTMASHVGWEAERRYTPSPVPTTPSTGAPGGAGASN